MILFVTELGGFVDIARHENVILTGCGQIDSLQVFNDFEFAQEYLIQGLKLFRLSIRLTRIGTHAIAE